MKKSTFIKRFIALLLVVLISIDTFAALVGDNDGAAFITKAEFDSMKNNFHGQLDRYNASIDNKIDGAIASYLSGIKVAKETIQEIIVERYKELFWCHDFSLYAIEKTWLSASSSNKSTGVKTPNYTNMTGYVPWRTDRGARGQLDISSFWGSTAGGFWLDWNSDSGVSRNAGDEQGDHPFRYVIPILCINVNSDWSIRQESLIQFIRTFYTFARFGLKPNLGHGFVLIPSTTSSDKTIYWTPQAANPGEYVRLRFAQEDVEDPDNYWYEIWDQNNTEAFPVIKSPYDEVESGYGSIQGTLWTYPRRAYYAPSAEQAAADLDRIYRMMIGTNTSTKAVMMFNLKEGGRTGNVLRDLTDNEESVDWGGVDPGVGYLFPDWSFWDHGTVNATIQFPDYMYAYTMNRNTGFNINIAKQSAAVGTIDLSLPISTSFNINRLKSEIATYKNQPLEICGGIPIAEDIQNKGTLKVEIKCSKAYDNIAGSAISDANAKIKFKRSKFTESSTDYLYGTYIGSSGSVKQDGSVTINLKNQTFKLDVEKGDAVWMNIDPITLGQHIKITDLKVTMIDE